MTRVLLPLLPLLSGCLLLYPHSEDDNPAEVSSISSADSHRLGVFLRPYAVPSVPPYLEVQEAYVEERFYMSGTPKQVTRIDTTNYYVANLILVLVKPPPLGYQHFDWSIFLANGVSFEVPRELSYAEPVIPTVYRFKLKHFKLSNSPSYQLRLHLKHGGPAGAAKDVDFTATPR